MVMLKLFGELQTLRIVSNHKKIYLYTTALVTLIQVHIGFKGTILSLMI